jgi:hypothetical protein
MPQTPEDFFASLKTKIELAYADSVTPINFAICDTPIQKGKDIIAGINWGDISKGPQTRYPEADKDRNWRFLKSSETFFIKHLGIKLSELSQINYTNLCFRRTAEAKHLKPKDWDISLPFKQYVEYIKPKRILILGTSSINRLKKDSDMKVIKTHSVKDEKGTAKGYILEICGVTTYCLPHPGAKISSPAREEIWKRVFEQ